MAALGLGVLVAALVGAAAPYRQTREFREVVACDDRGADGCFGSEAGSVAARRTYTTTTTSTDANGHTSTSTTTHYEVTWQRADGSRQTSDVSEDFYGKAREGEPARLRLWRGEVVGVEVMGGEQWFLPEAGETLGYWLYLAYLGLGVMLWGLLYGWWDGFFMLAFRTFAWMFMSFVPVSMATDALAYGLDGGTGLVVQIVLALFFAGIAGWMLLGSLERW
ncbi:DUF2500 family protein [Nonomuraea jiangxiensis]|uniref:DUF3592 domain-containing protein n=1 Tax=Nonomuraea jiangxiensis TaxID=633440 RepID=A0A1G9EG90_9ACTN|nr:DUF2500 family protein [Nonomuraea jiangxiensis]SDK75136.1 Protein of unknown function [Nonomuraea jiangxiensis]